MASNRKPIPKSQKEISNDQVTPYVNPNTGVASDNLNTTQDFRQFTPNSQKGVDFNRSEKMSFKGDTTKPFTLNIQDVDEAILYYFNNVIKPTVYQNGERIPVPLVYGSPERFKAIQKDGFLRDKKGKVMMPLIMFKRDTLEKNRKITNKLDANSPNIYTSWEKVYNSKNDYSNFEVLNNRIPTKQFMANVVPDYVTLTYSFIVQTYYVEQLNKIIEAINYASDSYWGNPARFKFKAMIDSFNTVTELKQGEDRVVRSNFTLKVYGYIIPDTIQKDLNSIKKYNSKSKVVFGLETFTSGADFIEGTKKPSPLFIDSPSSPTLPSSQISAEMLTYLNTNVQRLGSFTNPTTITFASGWLPAPSGLPATSLSNFTLFCNGVLIEDAAVSTFTQIGGITTLVILPSELGYSFIASDEVIAIGKFSS